MTPSPQMLRPGIAAMPVCDVVFDGHGGWVPVPFAQEQVEVQVCQRPLEVPHSSIPVPAGAEAIRLGAVGEQDAVNIPLRQCTSDRIELAWHRGSLLIRL